MADLVGHLRRALVLPHQLCDDSVLGSVELIVREFSAEALPLVSQVPNDVFLFHAFAHQIYAEKTRFLVVEVKRAEAVTQVVGGGAQTQITGTISSAAESSVPTADQLNKASINA